MIAITPWRTHGFSPSGGRFFCTHHELLLPLFVYFNAELHDHLTCASQQSIAYAKANGYSLVQKAPIGYVYSAPEWSESMQ